MSKPRPSDWERIVSHLLEDTEAALAEEPDGRAALARAYGRGYRAARRRARAGAEIPVGYDHEVRLGLRRHEEQARRTGRKISCPRGRGSFPAGEK